MVNNPATYTDPSGQDSCTWWNPWTYGGCAKNAYNSAKQEVKTVTDTVCSALSATCKAVNSIVKTTVQAVKAEIAALPRQIQQLKDMFVQDVTATARAYADVNNKVNQALSDAGTWVSHLHITDTSRFTKGLLECGALVVLVALTWEVHPEEVGTSAIMYGAATAGTLGPVATVAFAHDLYELTSFAVDLAVGCGTDTFGSISSS